MQIVMDGTGVLTRTKTEMEGCGRGEATIGERVTSKISRGGDGEKKRDRKRGTG